MKKLFAVVLALVLALSAVSAFAADVKLGVILLHDENSTYDLNFMNGANRAAEQLGIDVVFVRNTPESAAVEEAAEDLIDQDCNVIFCDSFGHETYLMNVAANHSDVQFAHATGTNAHTAGMANFHNAFAAIYEGRYLAGIAAGMKLNELREAGKLNGEHPKMGYVGAFTYAEVISGYTSFFLGAKSVCPDVTMEVMFTGSWYDEKEEKAAAEALMDAGADLISQHADSMGAPTACENRGVPNVSYNGSTAAACPNTFIVSSLIDWTPYFVYLCENAANGIDMDADWTGTIASGSVALTELGTVAPAAGTAEAIAAAKAEMEAGTLHVFDTATEGFITVNGAALTEYMADVDSDAAFTPDHQVVSEGYFHESEFRSAPYFDVQIDGITLRNSAF